VLSSPIGAGIFQVVLQMIQDHVRNAYKVEIKNTKSVAWGDPYCEMTASFTQINK
jgi:hypothetical protein